ncbi:hypothetical protein HMI54_007925 [Coelomomyces lativittatus]|nr:hypothetical protein HMI54_007925 [Coelomomyces lativittatus]KAJ1511112.1 hypothetical protein HMI55_006722 [Coelomomyces lativittatus]
MLRPVSDPTEMENTSTLFSTLSNPINRKDTTLPMRDRMASFVYDLQERIVRALEEVEGQEGCFLRDTWTRDDAKEGGGRTCVLQEGQVFERAGVNVSVIESTLSKEAVQQMKSRGKPFQEEEGTRFPFFAAGISLVLHPHHPMAPTVHLNYRFFELPTLQTWWFGGGSDLTPSYLFEEDAVHFHQTLKSTCDQFHPKFYPEFKQWCDQYFYLPHRKETRGVGGLFFDDLDTEAFDGCTQEHLFQFIQALGDSFLPSYLPILKKRMVDPHLVSVEEKKWQQLRRGRYVEFNLLYDRGTKFGILTPNARIESILISLPLTSRWEYMHQPVQDSPEAKLLHVLKHPRDWLSIRD